MQTKRIATIVTVVIALTLVLATSSTVAGPPVEGGSAEITLAGTVASKISYQGRLTDAGGNPLNGNYNLVFQLWDDASAGSQLGSDIPKNNVPVSNGLFTVELDVPQDAFNGQGLWLQISVNGQPLSPRQALLPVPYALSLRPGATISSPGPTALNAVNQVGGYGLQAQSQGNIGLVGVSGSGSYAPSGMHGVHGKGDGVGVYGQGGHTGVYGNGTNDGVKGESSTGNGVHGLSSSGVAVYSEGDLYVTGAFRGDLGGGGGAPFPRPAYDSGWQAIAQGQIRALTHGLGGDPDNYVVDVQFKGGGYGRHQIYYGLMAYYESGTDTHLWYGGYWYGLTDQSITVGRADNDASMYEVRVRIWIVR